MGSKPGAAGQHFLAVDLGAESGRTIIGSFDGGCLTLTETHRFSNQPVRRTDGLYWNVHRLWAEIKQGIRTSAGLFPLSSLALDTWGVDFALLDRSGQLVGDPNHYRDERTDRMLEKALQIVPRELIFAQTGVQFLQINTLYQLLAMKLTGDPRLQQARTFLTIPDLFNHWLCGSQVCEFTNATTTQCFNPQTRDWAWELLTELGIPTHIFPEVCDPGMILGPLLPEMAAETGAGTIPVIAPACHDTGSAVTAVPAETPDFVWISSGTWSIMGVEVSQPNLSLKAQEFNFTNEGGVFNTWRLSKNIMGLWLIQECAREWGRSYDVITQMAAEAPEFLAVINPDDARFLHPGSMAEKIRDYCRETGQAVPDSEGAAARVVLESLALKYRWTLERLEELTGKHLAPLHIFGGGSKNPLLNQLTADSTGRMVVAGPVEATAAGNILLQAITLGYLDSLAAGRALVRSSFDLQQYHPSGKTGWDESFFKMQQFMRLP